MNLLVSLIVNLNVDLIVNLIVNLNADLIVNLIVNLILYIYIKGVSTNTIFALHGVFQEPKCVLRGD